MSDIMARACLPNYNPKSVKIFDLPSGRGFFVIDTAILGRFWGGARIARDLTLDEIRILARSMAVKSILAGIPIGGSKVGLQINQTYDKTMLIDSLSRVLDKSIRNGKHFLGTDIGFSENDANRLYEMIGTKRRIFSGKISVGESSATGVLECIGYFSKNSSDLNGGAVAIEGFGRLGSATAKLLSSRGFKIVAISNIDGTIYDPSGLDIDELLTLSNQDPKKLFQTYLQRHLNVEFYPKEKIKFIQCDILIPGARTFFIDAPDAEKIKVKMICPLSNAPVTLDGERILAKRGIISVPDVISNSGGVIGSVAQHLGSHSVKYLISEIIQRNLGFVYDNLERFQIPKHVASQIALKRLQELEKHQRTGSIKLVLSWIRRIGPSALFEAVKEYLSLMENENN
jgi:glutamate dehydrogenase (NAD(P)+)